MGPYTDKAAGGELSLPPLDPLEGEAAAPSALSDPSATDQALSGQASTQGAAALEEPGRRRGLRIRDAAYGPTTDDLFPNRNRDIMVGRSTQVGKYGGSPLFDGGGGLLPLGVVGGKMRAIEQERAQLRKQAEDLNLFADFDQVNRAEYQPSLQSAQTGVVNRWMEASIAAHGDKLEAMRAFADPTNKWHQGLYRDIANVNATTKLVNQNIADAQSVIKGMDDGELEYEQGTYDQANEYLQKLGQWGEKDWEDLAGVSVRFNRRMNLMRQLKNDGVLDMLKDPRQSVDQQAAPRMDKFGRIVDTKTTDKGSPDLITRVAPRYARKNGMNASEVEEVLRGIQKTEHSIDQEAHFRPRSGSGGSGSSGAGGHKGYSFSYQNAPIKLQGDKAPTQYDQVVLADMTGNKGQFASPRQFYGASGQPFFVHPVAIVQNKDGGQYIYGKRAKEPGTVRMEQNEDGSMNIIEQIKGGGERRVPETEYFSKLQDVLVNYDRDNSGLVETYFPGLTPEVVNRTIQEGRARQLATQKPKAAAAETPPMAGAKKAPDGKWYVKKGDKWFRVDQ